MTAAPAMAAATPTHLASTGVPPLTGGPVSVAVGPPAGQTDYAAAYGDYWSRAERWGSSSFGDVAMLAHQILVTCGSGKLLDVGCGMGVLVRELLSNGVDAFGVDVATKPVEHGNTLAAGRFVAGSALALPFADGSFDTVVCTDCLEHLAEADVPRALAELARVARRSVYVAVATRPDRDRRWHLTVRGREWWEQQLIEAGLRKHPAASGVLPYGSLEHDGGSATLIMEKLPAEAAREFPLESLRAGRGLHMDMLREAGRRSDAHIARYALAAGYVRRADTVLDAACGLGYGAAVLAAGSTLRKVIGIDNDPAAVRYAGLNFGQDPERRSFSTGDCHELSTIADNSIDLVVSFETLEHLRDPAAFLAHAQRALRPGGRLIASVPNDWTDHTGRDPNPHHLHVYTWDSLSRQIREHGFEIERAYAQTAGGGMKFSDQPRRMTALTVGADGALQAPAGAKGESPALPPAEWWIVVAMKPATGEGAPRVPFVSRWSDPSAGPDELSNPVAFGRDYRNPWLADAMVTIGHRTSDPRVLESIARRALAESPAGSADAGAALCVLGYRLLEQRAATAHEVDAMLASLAAFDDAAANSAVPHVLRWRISNRFVAARLLLLVGRRGPAREMFLRCAELDPVPFSPLLASKTVESLFLAGVLAATDGEKEKARQAWVRGLNETRRVLSGDWRDIWGSPEHPASFSLPEVAAIADAGSMCASALIGLDDWADRPGAVWRSLRAGTKSDLRSWIAHLERNQGGFARDARGAGSVQDATWLETQVANWREAAEARERDALSLKQWCDQLVEAKTWLESKLAEAHADAARRSSEYEEARRWLKGQIDNWRDETARRDASIVELKAWTDQLEAAKKWLGDELELARGRIDAAEKRATQAEAIASDAAAEVGRRAVELGAQINALRGANLDASEIIRGLRAEQHNLRVAIADQKQQIRSMHTAGGLLKAIGRIVTGRRPKA